MTSWTAPGWLESFKIAVPGFVVPPIFTTGPMASKEPIISLLAATGFINIVVEPITFEHTDNVGRYLNYMKRVVAQLLVGEKAEKYEAYMRERYGDGDFTLTWKALVITAEKP
jgi:hypothetical protein